MKSRGFSENIAHWLFSQIMSGLCFMNNNGLAHRDMKTENIFLDKNCVPKIGDFGCSKNFN
jgi:serine/threonine protein kinase